MQSPTAMIWEVVPEQLAAAARAEECARPLLRRRFIPICPRLRCDRFGILARASALVLTFASRCGWLLCECWNQGLFVARDRGEPGQVLQQDPAALQIE